MKNMKNLLAIVLCIIMIFTLAACGEKADAPESPSTSGVTDTDETKSSVGENETTEPEVTELEEEEPDVPEYEPVTIGDCIISFDGAEIVDYYGDGFKNLFVYYTFTNNASEEKSASQMVFVQAKAGEEAVKESAYPNDKAPEEQLNVYTKIAPGETIRCLVVLQYDGTQADSIEVTIMDLYHQAPDSLVLDIAAADLPITIEAE